MSTALATSHHRASTGLGRSIAGRIGFLPVLLVALIAGMATVDPQFYGIINMLISCATPRSWRSSPVARRW
jgi:ribose transport system permease protein